MKLPVFLVALATLPLAAFAQTQTEMNEEASADFKKADAALNAAYRKVKAAQDEDGVAKLKAAQRSWIAYRDAEAAFEAAPNEGGSVYALTLLTVKTRITEARTRELEESLASGEGSDPASDAHSGGDDSGT